jgi:hypothetical protein
VEKYQYKVLPDHTIKRRNIAHLNNIVAVRSKSKEVWTHWTEDYEFSNSKGTATM